MKKKLAMLLAGVMALSMVPMTAFAKSTNHVTRVAVAKVDDSFSTNAPALKLTTDDVVEDGSTTQAIQLTLTNAEWTNPATYAASVTGMSNVQVTKLTAKSIIVEGKVTGDLVFPMLVKLTAKGDATVTVDPRESVYTAGEYKFATVTSGAAAVTSAGVKSVAEKANGTLKDIVIEETVEGTLETGTLKLRLTKGWSFDSIGTINVYPLGAATFGTPVINGRDAEIPVTVATGNDRAIVVTFAPTVSWDEDKVEAGDVCEMLVKGAGVDEVTLEVAKAITYGFSWTAQNKALKEIYWGTEGKGLKVTFEETVAESWLDGRKTQIEFTEGVKVTEVKVTVDGGVTDISGTYALASEATTVPFKVNKDMDVLTFTNDWVRTTGPVDVTFEFKFDVKPGFTGDISATLCGKGVESEELEAVLATAIAPVTIEVVKSDVVLDYRHTAIGDIIITEAEAGLLKDNENITFALENKLMFDDEPEVEVVAGDIEIDDITIDGNKMTVTVETESIKEASTIKITGATLYMERDIPAGDFYLDLVKSATNDALFNNTAWTTSKVKVAKDYVTVVTAGRDVDETFTTTLVVTAGATEMKANDKVIALDVPAYITNDGRMMLPVRAVIEALSGSAIVAWDDAAKQITISTGSRVVAMKVGSDVMSINGVEVPMVKACEIVDSRAFVPVRDLGYALGLNDASIAYDAATSTATLN